MVFAIDGPRGSRLATPDADITGAGAVDELIVEITTSPPDAVAAEPILPEAPAKAVDEDALDMHPEDGLLPFGYLPRRRPGSPST